MSVLTRVPTGMAPGDQPLTSVECRSWVSNRHEGRLGHLTGRGPRTVVISYATTDTQLVFRVPDYNPISQYVPGQPITVTVGAHSSIRAFTDVQVSGVGYVPDDQDQLGQLVDLGPGWPAGVVSHIICLDLDRVEGHTRTVG